MNSSNAHSEDFGLAEDAFRLVVESSPAAIVIVDRRGIIVMVNRQTETWFGFTRDELVGESVEVLLPTRYRERHVVDRSKFLEAPLARPMGAGHDLFARRKDDSEMPVDISLHPMETRQGSLVMAHIVDLTLQKQMEVETQKNHTLERLALLGQFAGGVAHEIRNPLGVIRNAAYYLNLANESLDEECRASVDEILQEVERANHIVSDLLDYAREAPLRKSIFDIVEFVRTFARQCKQVGEQGLRVESELEVFNVDVDSDQIRRVLENLITNAVQATSEPPTITISISSFESGVAITVRDAGIGVRPDIRLRIFEPMFTTKTKGIGLGLAISRRYAERAGGSLELVEETSPGAAFRLYLPGIE